MVCSQRSLTRVRSGCAAVLAAGAMLAVAPTAGAALTTWNFGSATLGYYQMSEGGPEFVAYDAQTVQVSVDANPIEEGIEIYGMGNAGSAFTIDAADYNAGLVGDPELSGNFFEVRGDGTFNGARWQHPQDLIRSFFDLYLNFNEGAVNVLELSTSFTLLDIGNNVTTAVGSGGYTNSFAAGSHLIDAVYEDRFNENFENAVAFEWKFLVRFEWLIPRSVASGLTLGFNENNTNLTSIPAPGAAAGLALLGLAGLRRRR